MMRPVSLSLTALRVLIVGWALPLIAQQAPCPQITAACKNAGFTQGGLSTGTGLLADCVFPIMQGVAQPAKATLPLPQVAPQLVAACKARNPAFGQKKGGAVPAADFVRASPAPPAQPLVTPTPTVASTASPTAQSAPPTISSAVTGGNVVTPDSKLKTRTDTSGPAKPTDLKLDPGGELVPLQRAPPPLSNGPIIVNWDMKKGPGHTNLLINRDGTYLFSGNYKPAVPKMDIDVVLALKSDVGASYLFRYTGNASAGNVQWSEPGQSDILKEDFKLFATGYQWLGRYEFSLTPQAEKTKSRDERYNCQKIADGLNGAYGWLHGLLEGGYPKYCAQFNPAWVN